MSFTVNNNKLILITNKETGANLELTFPRDVGYITFIFNKSYKNEFRPYIRALPKPKERRGPGDSIHMVTRGPFLERPGKFLGPKSNIQIELKIIKAQVLPRKLLHFVSSTDSFIMLDAKLL